MTRSLLRHLFGCLAIGLLSLLLMLPSCSSDDPEGDGGGAADGAATGDAMATGDAPLDGETADSFVHTDASWDGAVPIDADPACSQWESWHCEGEYPNYQAVCPPGNDPQLIITCVPSQMCYCKVTGVAGERECGFTPDPIGGSVCSSMEQIFDKGCCQP